MEGGQIIDETETFEVNGEEAGARKISISLREAIGAAASTASVVPPPPVMTEDTGLRNKLEKQRDKAQCFGFKDDDEEDEAILSMPAAHAQ